MDWKPFQGADDARDVVAWAMPALQALADAMAQAATATLWIPGAEMRGQHSIIWQIAGTGQLRSIHNGSLLWPGTLIVRAGDAEESAHLIPSDNAQQIELRAINHDLALIIHRCDPESSTIWREQYRFPSGHGRHWQHLLDCALHCGRGEQAADIGNPLLVAALRIACQALETPARPHRGRRLRQQQIERFAMKHFNQPECSTKTIAAALELSRSHVQKVFKQHSGENLNGFILRQRLRKADHLIAKGAEEDDQLAKRCGFKDLDELKAGRTETATH